MESVCGIMVFFCRLLALDNFHKDSCLGGTDPYYVASCYYLYSAELTAKAAAALGKGEDALLYTKLAEEVREAIRKEYFTSTGRIAVDTQTAMVLALRFGIVPEGAKDAFDPVVENQTGRRKNSSYYRICGNTISLPGIDGEWTGRVCLYITS